MAIGEIIGSEQMRSLVEDYRAMCFWNFSEDFMPSTREQVILALDAVERYGDLNAYRRAGEIRKWL